jgi:hypothetical protein
MRTTLVTAALIGGCSTHAATDSDQSSATDPCIKLIENGGFEHDLAHWNATSGVSVLTTGCFAGNKCARIGDGGVLSQSATIPMDGTTSIVFQAQFVCPTPGSNKHQQARIRDAAGNEVLKLLDGCSNEGTQFFPMLFSASQLRGQPVTFEISVTSPGDPTTALVIDAVQIENHADEGPVNACGVGSCDHNPLCEECLQDGECADGPDPVWTGTGCACPFFTPDSCELPYCCGPDGYWDPKACELGVLDCMPKGFANTCDVGGCAGNAACDACLSGPACDTGVQPVWDGSQCLCPIPPPATPPKNCFFPYCCATGTHWDEVKCACVVGPVG